jgi:hypothetical protein
MRQYHFINHVYYLRYCKSAQFHIKYLSQNKLIRNLYKYPIHNPKTYINSTFTRQIPPSLKLILKSIYQTRTIYFNAFTRQFHYRQQFSIKSIITKENFNYRRPKNCKYLYTIFVYKNKFYPRELEFSCFWYNFSEKV